MCCKILFMAPPRMLPPVEQLQRWVDEGYTHEQIAELILIQTGEKVSRSTVSVALYRANKTKPKARFENELPWKIKTQHAARYPARMLRVLARRNRGMDVPPEEDHKLDLWLDKISQQGIVVAYDPDSEPGFFYVPARGKDGKDGIPIRRGITRLPANAKPIN